MKRLRRHVENRADGTIGEAYIEEEVEGGANVDLSALDEPRTVAEGDSDAADLAELLGVGRAEVSRRALRLAVTLKLSEKK